MIRSLPLAVLKRFAMIVGQPQRHFEIAKSCRDAMLTHIEFREDLVARGMNLET